MAVLTVTTHRATVYVLTRTVGDLDHGTVVLPITRDGHPLASGAFYVAEYVTGRGAHVLASDVTLVTGPAVIIEHVAGWFTVLPVDTEDLALRTAGAIETARPALPAVASVRAVDIIRQH